MRRLRDPTVTATLVCTQDNQQRSLTHPAGHRVQVEAPWREKVPARQLPSHMEDDRPDRAPKRPAGLRHTRTQARRACHTAASTPPSADTYTLTCTHGESLETVRWRTNKHTQNTKQWTTMPRQSDDMAHAAGRTKVRMPTSRCRRSCQEHRAWARTRAAVARTVDNHTRGHTKEPTRVSAA